MPSAFFAGVCAADRAWGNAITASSAAPAVDRARRRRMATRFMRRLLDGRLKTADYMRSKRPPQRDRLPRVLLFLTAVIVSASLSAAPQTPQSDSRLQESDRLFEQAQALQKDGKIRDAIDVARKAATIVERIRGDMHLDTADALSNVGQLQFLAQDYAQAVQNFSRAVAIQEKLLPADSPDLAISLNDLANAYRGTG